MKLFDLIKLKKENKMLKCRIRTLEKQLSEQGLRFAEDYRKLKNDYMRVIKPDTLAVGVDKDGKVMEYTKYTPHYYLIDKTGDTGESND